MKLDPRIYKDKKPLDCFDIQKAKKFIGAKGYFSPYIDYFGDLKLTHYGTLLDIDDKSTTPYGINDDEYYVFFPSFRLGKKHRRRTAVCRGLFKAFYAYS